MVGIGYLELFSEDGNFPHRDRLVVKQFWPTSETLSLGDDSIADIVPGTSSGVFDSPGMLSTFLAEGTVTYTTNGQAATNVTRHPFPAPLNTTFQWYPVLPADTPFELESYVTTMQPTWSGPPADNKADIQVIANGKIASGLSLKKFGKRQRIVVKQSPLQFASIHTKTGIVKDSIGWYIPESPTTSVYEPTEPQEAPLTQNAHSVIPDETPSFDTFVRYIQSRGLFYDQDDLVLLYASIRSGQFVVLGGTGGIGKSSLALATATYLGCTHDNQRLAWLTVEPSWISSSQLMGQYDPAARIYRAALGGLADVMIHAERAPAEQLHLVCLDELNLARIEHYLAPWLSLKEHPETPGWPLYSNRLESECLNRSDYPASIHMSPNIVWMGTVNMDEASFGLTDKFLDRTVYIALRRSPFATQPVSTEQTVVPVPFPSKLPFPVNLSATELSYFDELNAIAGIPLIAWRTLNAIRRSIACLPGNSQSPIWDAQKAWDEHLAARVLSKFRGAGVQWDQWLPHLSTLRTRLESSPWGPLGRSSEVLSEIKRNRVDLGF